MKKVTLRQLGNAFLTAIRYLLLYISFLFIVAFVSSLIVNEFIKFCTDILLSLFFILIIIFIARRTDGFTGLSSKPLSLKEAIVPLILATTLYILSVVFIFIINQDSILIDYFPNRLNDVIILAIYVAFHGGVKEELFFRGVLYETVNSSSQNVIVTLVFTSIAFGMVHTFDNVISTATIYYVLMGLLLGLLKLWSKNILAPILFHTGWNIWIAFTNKINNIAPLISISFLNSAQQPQIDAITALVFFLSIVGFVVFSRQTLKLVDD